MRIEDGYSRLYYLFTPNALLSAIDLFARLVEESPSLRACCIDAAFFSFRFFRSSVVYYKYTHIDAHAHACSRGHRAVEPEVGGCFEGFEVCLMLKIAGFLVGN